LDKGIEFYSPADGQRIYSDKDFTIRQATGELKDLKGIRFSYEQQISTGTIVKFRNDKPLS